MIFISIQLKKGITTLWKTPKPKNAIAMHCTYTKKPRAETLPAPHRPLSLM